MEESIKVLIVKANAGDRKSLNKVIESIKDIVYNLSLRMLLFPEDAQDATQEILVKVVTHLSTFKGDSKFTTWVYRIATNYLLTQKGKKSSKFTLSFDEYADLIDTGQSEFIKHTQNLGEQLLLEEEVKISCTHGMLLCLNQTNRLVYILGVLLEFTSVEGANILGIKPENFRKQLSRSKIKLRSFMQAKCGLTNPKNPCRCSKKIDFLIDRKMINPNSLQYVKNKERSIDLIQKINALEKTTAIFRSTPQYTTPAVVVKKMRETLNLHNVG